jgi:CDP-diglyceride synthetase
MKELTLRREICDTLAIIIVATCASLIGQSWPVRILLAICFIVSCVEIFITSYRKDRECYPTKAAIMFTATTHILLMVATVLVIFVRLDEREYLLILGLAMTSDAAGLICGRIFGSRRPCFSKHISPNKTWAGYIGSLIGTWCFGVIAMTVLGISWDLRYILLIALASTVSSIGDLFGSGTKRELGIKHSSDYTLDLPVIKKLEVLMRSRHGYLDCMDSVSCMIIFATILLS